MFAIKLSIPYAMDLRGKLLAEITFWFNFLMKRINYTDIIMLIIIFIIREMEDAVVSVLEGMWNDSDERVRKKVRRALGSYRRTGNWNIL